MFQKSIIQNEGVFILLFEVLERSGSKVTLFFIESFQSSKFSNIYYFALYYEKLKRRYLMRVFYDHLEQICMIINGGSIRVNLIHESIQMQIKSDRSHHEQFLDLDNEFYTLRSF